MKIFICQWLFFRLSNSSQNGENVSVTFIAFQFFWGVTHENWPINIRFGTLITEDNRLYGNPKIHSLWLMGARILFCDGCFRLWRAYFGTHSIVFHIVAVMDVETSNLVPRPPLSLPGLVTGTCSGLVRPSRYLQPMGVPPREMSQTWFVCTVVPLEPKARGMTCTLSKVTVTSAVG